MAEPLEDNSAVDELDTDASGTDAGGDTGKPDLTIVNDDGDDKIVTVPASWPEDWRDRALKEAGGDEKLAARLKRFASVGGIVKSWLNAEKKINSGTLIQPLAENATDEEKVAWRVANNIPESPEKYDTNLGEGMVLGEEDKPIVDSFLKDAFEGNLNNDQAKTALKWYYKFQDERAQAVYNADAEAREEGVTILKEEWGQEYKPNLNAVRGWMDSVDPEAFDTLFSARDSQGRLIGNNPVIVRMMVEAARSINPAATVIPGSTTTSGKGVEDEIAAIENDMRTNEKAYFKNEAKQARYRQLLEAREKLKARG